MYSLGVMLLTLASIAQSQTVSSSGNTEPKTSVIRFYAPVNEVTVGKLLNVVDEKIKQGTKRIVLLISSPGGSVFAGLSAYHYLKGVPVEVITHNFGEVDSIAAVIFCAGSKRYSVPQGRFLLHGVSVNFAANIPFEEGRIGEQLKLMRQQESAIASVLSETTKQPLTQVQSWVTNKTVLAAQDALKNGLVQEIRTKLYDPGAELIPIADVRSIQQREMAENGEITYTTGGDRFFTATVDFFTRIPSFSTVKSDPWITQSGDLGFTESDPIWTTRDQSRQQPSPE